jgi:hypothetical protein
MPPIRHIRAPNLQLQQHTGHAFCDMPKLKRGQVIQLMSNKPKEINPIEGPEGEANRGSQGKKSYRKSSIGLSILPVNGYRQ